MFKVEDRRRRSSEKVSAGGRCVVMHCALFSSGAGHISIAAEMTVVSMCWPYGPELRNPGSKRFKTLLFEEELGRRETTRVTS